MAKLADKMYLKRLLETPSVTGMESLVASLVRERLAECADMIETDVMGSVHARLLGNGSAPSVMIAAHMDEVVLFPLGVLMRLSCRVFALMCIFRRVSCVAWWVASLFTLSNPTSEPR